MDTSKATRFYNGTRGKSLSERTLMADSFFLRLRGLLFRPQLQAGEGLFLNPCNSIHMFGMAYAIDVVFFDRDWRVVGLLEGIKPGRVSTVYKSARSCLELPEGTISATSTQIGDLVEIS